MSLMEARSLYQRYGEKKILKDINIEVEKGEVVVVIGPTGAGKTTLLRLIDLLEVPVSGDIYFDGVCIPRSGKQRLEARRRMAFVLQKPVVFNMSVYDNIACGLKWRGVNRSSIRQKTNGILEMVGLAAYRNRNARTLSGGEAQRVAIARAIAIEPEVLLLDEPTANLDPISTSRIEELISRIIRQYKTTIVMSTHDMSQSQRLAGKIAVLISGEILQIGDSRQVFSLPRNREVAEFVGVENIIDGVIIANEQGIAIIDVGGISIEAVSNHAIGERVSVCIRPEEVTLALSKTPSSARNSFIGEVAQIVPIGSFTRIDIDCGFPLTALVTKRSAEELGLKSGSGVYATFKATGVHVVRKDTG